MFFLFFLQILADNNANLNPIMKTSDGQLVTPLDLALRRNFRTCERFLRGLGALPAARILQSNTLPE